MSKTKKLRNDIKELMINLFQGFEDQLLNSIDKPSQAYRNRYKSKRSFCKTFLDFLEESSDLYCSLSTAENAFDELVREGIIYKDNISTKCFRIKKVPKSTPFLEYLTYEQITIFTDELFCYLELPHQGSDMLSEFLNSQFEHYDVRCYPITPNLVQCIDLLTTERGDDDPVTGLPTYNIEDKTWIYTRILTLLQNYDFKNIRQINKYY